MYNRNGILLTEENDPVNMGTYNYYGPALNRILHGYFDVVPYNVWGNVKGTPGRIIPRDKDDFYSNVEAQDAYNRINEIMNAQ